MSPPTPPKTLRQRLADLRGADVAPRPLDARALAALAANPGCGRRALLDGAGVDKTVLAAALGSPAAFGQSQFAIVRGNSFEAKVKGDGGAELLRLVYEHLGAGFDDAGPAGAAGPPGPDALTPDLTAAGPQGRAARTALALREATAAGAWTLLDHPMLALEVAGSPAYLEPDAVVVHPDGRWTVVEIKSFPMIDGSADAAKVGAAARQAAVYVLALETTAAKVKGAEVGHTVLLVCPKDFSNLPTAAPVDIRRERSVTRRQLERLTRVEELAESLPAGLTFDPACSAEELTEAVSAVSAAYAPECLAACELAFHCRDRARTADEVTTLGRSVRGELGGLTTVEAALAAAAGCGAPGGTGPDGTDGTGPAPDVAFEDPTAAALRYAARLRAEALEQAPARIRPKVVECPC
ncbi:hypothetical protein OHA37_24585 [Streptomyces sp. NBC_00335]|uniref:hypothetical protein n=1 Tax=unclassified Streptomyces TaxID=2593676 RepID=UPI002257CE3C|nr:MULTISPECIES: hypothetical protein [unclassified Streptomyces]MCX5407032.1 hypothetical protein [Streptomyces sp. NBC_00086]